MRFGISGRGEEMNLNRLSRKAIAGVLPSELIRWDVHYIPTVDSTQKYAAEIFPKRGRGGVFFGTNFQSAGRGREGRAWIAPRGKALLFSLVLIPRRPGDHHHFLTIVTALAVCEALRSHLALKPGMKWPNDVLVNGKKVCGILTEMVRSHDGEPGLVAGVGLNVNQGRSSFPGDLSGVATSLSLETGERIPRLPLLGSLMKSFEDQYFLFQKGQSDEIIRRWKGYSSILGRYVSIRKGKREIRGTVVDLEDTGAIVLRLDSGRTESFLGSECRFL